MLPNDYSRCATKGCPKEGICARKEFPKFSVYSESFFNKDNCTDFIPKEIKSKKPLDLKDR